LILQPLDLGFIANQNSNNETVQDLDLSGTLSDVAHRALVLVERKKIIEALENNSGNKSRTAEDLGISYKTLLNKLKEVLKDKVEDVRFSTRLVDSPVCLASSEGMSFGMEKAINELPNQEKVKTGRILELNPNHDLLKAIEKVYANNPDDINEYASLLFNQALLIEGLPLENPSEFSKQMVDLMIKSAK
jgi:molecular chaperone HtpG